MQEQVVQNGVNTKTYFVIVWLLFTAEVVPFNMLYSDFHKKINLSNKTCLNIHNWVPKFWINLEENNKIWSKIHLGPRKFQPPITKRIENFSTLIHTFPPQGTQNVEKIPDIQIYMLK